MKKILVLDHHDMVEFWQMVLTRWGYQCYGVLNVDEAVRKYREVCPDIVLAEQCKNISGLAFVSEVCVPNRTPFIIFNTPVRPGEFQEVEREISNIQGCAALEKPFPMRILKQKLIALLGE